MNISKTLNIVSLSKYDEIQRILIKGQRVHTKFGLLFLYNDNKDNISKIGILIKKKSGSAVKRNYIKRIMRQFIRNEFDLICQYNQIIFLYNYQGKISYKELRDTYINDLKRYEKSITYNN